MPILLFSSVVFITSFSFFHAGGMIFSSGSPYDGADCSTCHGGGASSPAFSITASPSFISGNLYSPGTTYTISILCAGAYPYYGFDLEILNDTTIGAGDAGIFNSALTNCQIIPTNKKPTNASHAGPVGTNDTALFQFTWTAPASGNAYLYCAVNGVNFDGNTTGDFGATKNLILSSAATGIISAPEKTGMEIFPNPSSGEFMLRTGMVKDVSAKIFTGSGQCILEYSGAASNKIFSLKDYPSGVYYMNIQSRTNTFHRTIIIYK